MFAKNILLVACAVGRVVSQTGPGFPIQNVNQTLGVTFLHNDTVSPAGKLIPGADTASSPNITTSVFSTTGKAILFLIDSDVSVNNTRTEYLHWLASNVTLGKDNKTLTIPTGEAPYRQPNPPAGDVAHAYTFLLFPQAANFSIPAQFNAVLANRTGFNITNFVSAAKLANPIAADYFRVQNTSGTPTASYAPARATNATATTTATKTASATASQFKGAAAGAFVDGAGKWAWTSGVFAVLVGGAAFAL